MTQTHHQVASAHHAPPNVVLLDMLNGMWLSYAIQAAAAFDFASLMGDGRKTTEALARETETQEAWVYRILRFLAASGIFAEVAPRTFENTELSTYLREDVRGSMKAMARMMGLERFRHEWADLETTVKTGVPAVERLYGHDLYSYFAAHPEEEEIFDKAMTSFSHVVNPAIASAYDFSQIHRLVDLGGGRGSLLEAILAQHPSVQYVLFDRPAVIEQLQSVGGGKVQLVAGNFFHQEEIPPADGYILKEVLHNWPDDVCVALLTNCRRALTAGKQVILVSELVVSPKNNEGSFAKGLDLLMGLEQRGQERTVEEFGKLFAKAGLRMRVIPTRSPHVLFEGTV